MGEDAIEMSLMLRKDSYKISIRKKCTTTLFPSLLSFPIKNGQFRYISTCDKRLQEYAIFFSLQIPYQSRAILFIYLFFVHFNIRIYLFFYTLTFQNTPHQIIYFTLHFIKISNFLNFFNYFSSFIHDNYHPLSFFVLEMRKERINN